MPKRRLFLDTETSGLAHQKGDRIIEIAILEQLSEGVSGAVFHTYLNPGCYIHPKATALHNLTDADVFNAPRFEDIADKFLEFIQDSEIIMHNAPFDTAFINKELSLLGVPLLHQREDITIVDSLTLARKIHKMPTAYEPFNSPKNAAVQKNTLNALCDRYSVIVPEHTRLHSAVGDVLRLLHLYPRLLAAKASQEA